MARAETRTLLPLDRFAQILGIPPLHFCQVTDPAMPDTVCSSVYKQFAWQEHDAVSREDIAQAIQEAERRMGDYLQYDLLPKWNVDERMPTVRPGIPGSWNITGRDVQGQRQSVQLRRGQFISGGIEAKTLIDADATVTYTDEDGDGYFETATIAVATTVTEPSEIAIYYPVAATIGGSAVYLPGGAASSAWEVRPLRSVVISAGTVTVKMWRHQLVIPVLLEALSPEAVDGQDADNFLPVVGVYRHWNDPQQQAELMWSPPSWGGGDCCSGCVTCTAAVQDGCLLGRDYRLGIVHYSPATWDADEDAFTSGESWCMARQPDRLRLWYYAGLQDKDRLYPTLQMDPSYERAVAYFAVTLLDRTICGCSNVEMIVKHWRTELNLNESDGVGSSSYQIGKQVLDNPFGQTRGAVFAWTKVASEGQKLGKAALL